ncbi:MAG: tape measure protein [Liquorilactobacillus nagelii]|uniref:phage tail protein n=1 Tax=Liquorilactobacillus nagelii TaxID=82688 RepID=UPI00242B1A56|nr:tape measure protein [Liquorilactobacillus nagelii]MCI1977818.1 tape measure protein [Liquorilactobacillus nagelii]
MSQSMSVEAVLSAYDESFSATLDKALKSINNLGRETQSTSQTVSAGGSSISSTFKSMAGAMGVIQLASGAFDLVKNSVGSAVKRMDTLNNATRTFSNMNFNTNQIQSAMNGLKESIKGLPTPLDQSVKGVQMIAAATGNLGKSQKVYSALNDSIIGFGGSTADVNNAVIQLSQAFANGKVDGMTWISMMNSNMGPVLNAIAKKLGMTTGQLKDGLSSGKISVKDFQNALIDLDKNGGGGLASLHSIAKDATSGIGTSFENMKTAISRGTATAIQALSEFSQEITGMSIADIISNIGTMFENAMNIIANALKILAPILKSIFGNDIFKTAVVGILGFVGAVMAAHKVISIFTTLRSAIVGLSVIAKAGNLAMAFSEAMSTLAKTSKVAGGAMKAFSAVASLGPWGIIAVAIVAVVAALTYFFTQTKTGKTLWQGFTTWLSGEWQSLVEVATTVWNAIGNAINAVVNFIKPYWQGLVTFFTGIWTSIVAGVAPIWQGLVNVFNSIISAIVAVWQALAPIIVPIVAGVVAIIGATLITIVTVFQTVWNMLVPIVQVVWQLISTVVSTAITMLGTVIQTGLAIIVAIWNVVWNTFSIVVSTVWNIISTIISTTLNVIAGIIQAITAAIQGDWSGAWNAIQNVVSTVLNAISSIVSSVLSGVAGIFSGVMNGLKSVVSAVWNGIKSLFSEGVNFIKSVVHIDLGAAGRAIMNSLWNGMKSIWNSIKNWVSGIADWIKEHKGPISYDRKLLIPAGQAIMNGLNNGLINGFSEVQSNVSDMANQIQQAITNPGFDIGTSIGNLGSINSNYTGSLAIQDSQLQMQNNALLRQLLNKDTTMVLDDGTLVGYTADQYDYRLGQNTALKDRWSR